MAKTMLSIIARNKVQFSPSGWRLCACVCLPLISGSVALALSFTTRQVNTIPPLSYLPISFLAKQPSDWFLQASWPKVIKIILISGIINQIGLVSACVPAIMKLQAEWRGRRKMASRCRLRRLASLGGLYRRTFAGMGVPQLHLEPRELSEASGEGGLNPTQARPASSSEAPCRDADWVACR